MSDWLGPIFIFAAELPPIFRLTPPSELSLEHILRTFYLLSCIVGSCLLWWSSSLSTSEKKAAAAAGIVHFLLSLTLDLAAVHFGVHRYLLTKHLFWGIPIDIHLAWAALWGTGLCLAWMQFRPRWRISFVAGLIGATLAMDFAAWRSGQVFEALRWDWCVYDLFGLIFLAISVLLFFKLIRENRMLYFRVIFYAFGYMAMFYVLLPAMVLGLGSGISFVPSTLLQPWTWIALTLTAIPGVWAAWQFATEGQGTPLPLDPTRKLVVTGVYAYVRNPMQISGLLSAVVWALSSQSVYMWVYALDLALLLFATGWYEDKEMTTRFGGEYIRYKNAVQKYWPRLTPYRENS